MVRIRLRQVGGRNQASFRIVAADKESPRNGRFIEILGYYNPRTQPATIQLKEDRIYQWMSKGAQPSDSAAAVFKTAGLDTRYERFKAGEKIETLLAEAEGSAAARNSNPKTRFSAPQQSKKPRKKEGEFAQAAEPVAEVQAVEPEAPEAPAEQSSSEA
ncbi:MAG: 30S ribosomal protein S16 [Anaerolineales bacterium]